MKKTFFQRRSEAEIKKLDCRVVDTPVGLVDTIEELDSAGQGLILDFPLVHPDFDNPDYSPQFNSRATVRGITRIGKGSRIYYSSYLPLGQPRSKDEANRATRLPCDVIQDSFKTMFSQVPEEKNFFVGTMRWPVSGKDMSPIFTPFWANMNGTQHDAYTGRVCRNLPSCFLNAGSFVKWTEGPNVFVQVPSQEKGERPYLQKWENVPYFPGARGNKVLAWNIRPRYGRIHGAEGFVEDEAAQPLWVAYQVGHERGARSGESSEFSIVDPRGVAGFQAMVRYFMAHPRRTNEPEVLKYSQVSIPSRDDMAYWNKLYNNILMRTVEDSRTVLRHPRIDQLSMLMARRIAKHALEKDQSYGGIPTTMYWHPERDGRIRDYPVLPGEK